MNKEKLGFTFAILDMITYGFLPVAAHYFVATIDPLLFGGLATLVGSIPILGILKKQNKVRELFRKDLIKPLLIIAVILNCSTIVFLLGTKITSSINTGLLIQTEPIYAIIFGSLFLKEIIRLPQVIATLLMIAGASIVVLKGGMQFNIGDLLILSGPVFNQTAHIIAIKAMKTKTNAMVISGARLFFGGILLTLVAILVNPTSLRQLVNIHTLAAIIFFGIIFRALDVTLWYQALERIPLSKASAVLPVAAAISFFGSIIFLKESPTAQQFVGLLAIIAGLVWFSLLHLRKPDKKRTK